MSKKLLVVSKEVSELHELFVVFEQERNEETNGWQFAKRDELFK